MWTAIGPTSCPGLLGGGGWGEEWLKAGSCLPCWCVYSFVGHFKSQREREAELGAQALEFTNIYVKNLSVDMDEQGLQDLFFAFGEQVPQGRRGSPVVLLPSPSLAEGRLRLGLLLSVREGRELLGALQLSSEPG